MTKAEQTEVVKTFLSTLPTEKGTVVTRMHNSFNFAFGIITLLAATLVVRQGGFQSDEVSWLALNGAIVLLSHFFIRTCKDYLNQIRFAHLQKVCLAFLSLEEPARVPFENVLHEIERYYVRWEAPVRALDVVKKTMTDHGFGILFSLVLIGHIVVGWSVIQKNFYWLATFVASMLIGCIDIWRSLQTFYFQCKVQAHTMRGLH